MQTPPDDPLRELCDLLAKAAAESAKLLQQYGRPVPPRKRRPATPATSPILDRLAALEKRAAELKKRKAETRPPTSWQPSNDSDPQNERDE